MQKTSSSANYPRTQSIDQDIPLRLDGKNVGFLLPDLNGGGVQRVVLRLADGLAKFGAHVDIVVCNNRGQLKELIPDGVTLVPLEQGHFLSERFQIIRAELPRISAMWRLSLETESAARPLRFLSSLSSYLKNRRPDTLFAATPYPNLLATLARQIAKSKTRLVLSERTYFSAGKPKKVRRAARIGKLMGLAYSKADGIVAVSRGVADDLARAIKIPRDSITTIHNPTLTPDFKQRLQQRVAHDWFNDPEIPLLLAIGRIGHQKDYDTLFRAFAIVRKQRRARIMIIGDVALRKKRKDRKVELDRLANELGIDQDITFLGYKSNPLPYLQHASVFVLSSMFEGFPNVLLEALGAGVPIVSTRCPSGPDEILDNGRYGILVPVGDDSAMAAGIVRMLDQPTEKKLLQERADFYGYWRSINAYARVLFGDARTR